MPFTCALFCLPHPSTDLPLPTCGTKNGFSLFKKHRPVVQLQNLLKPRVVYCAQRGSECGLSLWRLEAEHTSWWKTAGCQLLGTFWLGSVCSDLHPTHKVPHFLLPRGCALSPWVVQHHRLPLDHWQIGGILFSAEHLKEWSRRVDGVCFFDIENVLSFQTTWTLNDFLSQQLEEVKTLQEVSKTRKSLYGSQIWWWRRGLERSCLFEWASNA